MNNRREVKYFKCIFDKLELNSNILTMALELISLKKFSNMFYIFMFISPQ